MKHTGTFREIKWNPIIYKSTWRNEKRASGTFDSSKTRSYAFFVNRFPSRSSNELYRWTGNLSVASCIFLSVQISRKRTISIKRLMTVGRRLWRWLKKSLIVRWYLGSRAATTKMGARGKKNFGGPYCAEKMNSICKNFKNNYINNA